MSDKQVLKDYIAQWYISCAQIEVVNGGNGNPGPLVSIPGVYTGNVSPSQLTENTEPDD